MSDAPVTGPVEPARVRIDQDLPLIFADSVTSHFYGAGISKFYFSRFDPDPDAKGPPKVVNIIQVVMPTEGFAQMVFFFERRLKTMIKEGFITEERVDDIRRIAEAAHAE